MTHNIDPLAVLATDADVAGWMNEANLDQPCLFLLHVNFMQGIAS